MDRRPAPLVVAGGGRRRGLDAGDRRSRDRRVVPQWVAARHGDTHFLADPAHVDRRLLDAAAAQPFEELLLPLVHVARARLRRETGAAHALLHDAAHVALERDPDAAVALALVLLALSVGVLVALRERWLRPGAAP